MKQTLILILAALLLGGCASSPSTPGSGPQTQEDARVKTLVDLGTGYLRQGEYARAKEHLNRALSIDSRSATAHNALALVFQLEQEYEIAETHFKAALRANSEASTKVRNNYGAFLFELGRYDDAIRQLEIASEDRYYTSRPTVFENLGVSYLRIGDARQAEAAFERAVALNPDQPKALIELAAILFERQDYVRARQYYLRYQRVAQQTSKSLWLCVRLARVFEDANQEASCALALRNIFPASPEYAEYQESLGS